MKLEEDKFEYEKEKDNYDILRNEFGYNLENLDLELPNNIISNVSINEEIATTEDEDN